MKYDIFPFAALPLNFLKLHLFNFHLHACVCLHTLRSGAARTIVLCERRRRAGPLRPGQDRTCRRRFTKCLPATSCSANTAFTLPT